MTQEEKREFFLKLDQLSERVTRLREKVHAGALQSEERERASEASFKKFMEDLRRLQEGGGEPPPAPAGN